MKIARTVVAPVAGGCVAALLGGVIGLAWWCFRVRSRPPGRRLPGEPGSLLRRTVVAVVALLLVLIAVGTVWRTKVAVQHIATCKGPAGVQPTSSSAPPSAEVFVEDLTTWPETGLGMLYGKVLHDEQCFYDPADYYVDFHSGRFAGSRIVNIGDITLAPPFNTSLHEGQMVAEHEARHRSQWAVLTAIGGPFAFPVLYGVDDFFFPGSRNQFERLAGLNAGGYNDHGIGPVIGWPQRVVLIAATALIAMLVRRRLRRRLATSAPRNRD